MLSEGSESSKCLNRYDTKPKRRLFEMLKSQEIAGRIAQQLRRNVAGEGFVVHMAVRRSGDEKIIREILDRRDDGAGSRFPFNPAKLQLVDQALRETAFSMSKAPACTISKSAPQWLAKRLASANTPVNVGENVAATPTCW